MTSLLAGGPVVLRISKVIPRRSDTNSGAAAEVYDSLNRGLRKKTCWNDSEPLSLPAFGIDAYKLLFESRNSHYLVGSSSYHCPEHNLAFTGESDEEVGDVAIEQNRCFRYPLIRETRSGAGLVRHRHAIVLLHGLNERTFSKYVPWAYRLWSTTRVPVVLFPMTFHMNRVSPAWASQQQEIHQQRSVLAGNDCAHRFNAVISQRLNARPDRFFWGAVQTYWDLVDLVRTIRSGHHPHFTPDARVDLMGYSAGGFFTLLLLMENCEGLFCDSRGVVFASGVPIRDLELASPLILDLTAEVALMKLFVKNIDSPQDVRMQHWIEHHGEGRWIRTFCGQTPKRTEVEQRLRELAPRLLGIANSNDEVVPLGAVLNMLQGVKRDTGVKIVELELGIHENPFLAPRYEKDKPGRRLITGFLDEDLYGTAFGCFIDAVVGHFA